MRPMDHIQAQLLATIKNLRFLANPLLPNKDPRWDHPDPAGIQMAAYYRTGEAWQGLAAKALDDHDLLHADDADPPPPPIPDGPQYLAGRDFTFTPEGWNDPGRDPVEEWRRKIVDKDRETQDRQAALRLRDQIHGHVHAALTSEAQAADNLLISVHQRIRAVQAQERHDALQEGRKPRGVLVTVQVNPDTEG